MTGTKSPFATDAKSFLLGMFVATGIAVLSFVRSGHTPRSGNEIPHPSKAEVLLDCAPDSPSRTIILQGKNGPLTLTCKPK
jgi:hypothetical protein